MVFSSITFLFYFLPIVLILYYIVPKNIKNIILLITSLIFYFFSEPINFKLMIILIIITYLGGLLIDKLKIKNVVKENKDRKKNVNKSKFVLVILIIIDIALLVYFKYTNFIIQNINLWFKCKIDIINVILPIGISFYIFQIMSYLIDVYRDKINVQKNIFNLGLYISLFPQLIAGPIVRYSDIEKQICIREHTVSKFSNGIRRFIIGLSKKVLIANVLGEFINIYNSYNDNSLLFFIMYIVANGFQIYFDFSGYSDMAIGLGKMFGFDFMENFNYPYIANSITDFWRRWHISLSSWFKDYVYIPLGGNKKGIKRQIINILVVWILTGIWHGAEWNYIIWGLYFGIILIIEKLFLLKWLEKTPKLINKIYTLSIVFISFMIFSNENLNLIFNNLKDIFVSDINVLTNISMYYLGSYLMVFLVSIIGVTPFIKNIIEKLKNKNTILKNIINIFEPICLIFLLIVSVSYIIDGSFNPFLYFRF